MTRQSLAAAGTLLYGSDWQRPLSRALHVNDRLVRRWASGEKAIPSWVEGAIERLRLRVEKDSVDISDQVTDINAKCKTSRFDQIPS